MGVLGYIFYLGVIQLVFRFIWGLLFNMIVVLSGRPLGAALQRILSVVYVYLQVSLLAKFSVSQEAIFGNAWGLMIVGGFINFILLFSRFNKQKASFAFQVNGRNMIPDYSIERNRFEYTLVILGTLYFFLPFFLPQSVEYPMLNSFMELIADTYKAPFIGWLFKFIGAIYLIVIIFKSVSFFFGPPKIKEAKEVKGDDHFDDYEEVE